MDRSRGRRKSASVGSASIADKEASSDNASLRHSRGTQYHCDYCRKDISTNVRIRCAECADFDLCLECFSVGVEVFSHANNHRYRVIEHIVEPVFEKTWGADEERLLLEAIRMFGLGNWTDIADHVGSKTRVRCQQHYNAVFLNTCSGVPSFNAPLFDPREGRNKEVEKRVVLAPGQSRRKHRGSPAVTKAQDNSLARMVGYMPLRGDFETEYENDVELYLADMDIHDNDTPTERELKLQVIAQYNSVLDERERRKKFILERGLLFPQSRKRSREEKKIFENMSCFARFQSKEEHEDFLQGLLNEQRIRKRIEQLQQHRLHGITTLAEGELYEAERKKREVQANLRREKEKLAYLYSTPRSNYDRKRRSKVPDEKSHQDWKNNERSSSSSSLCTRRLKKESSLPSQTATSNENEWDMSKMDCVQQLSELERTMCVKLRLHPKQYLSIKESLLKESYRRGFLRPGHDRQLLRVDINKTERSFDIFMSSGWDVDESIFQQSSKDSSSIQ